MKPILLDQFEDFFTIREDTSPTQAETRGLWKPVYLCRLTFTPTLCRKYSRRIFVFGDNIDRVGTGGQAIIRVCDNAFGIRTKKAPQNVPSAFFNDRDYIWFQKLIEHDITNLTQLNRTNPIVFSSNGYGTGLGNLPIAAPKCYQYLCHRLNLFCGRDVFNPNFTG